MQTIKETLKHYVFYLGGDQPPVSWRERARIFLGAFLGLMFVITIAKTLGEMVGIDEWLMASLGASALIVFAMPQSPLAQPWAVIAGNTVSALVGISCAHLSDLPIPVALALAASCSILAMFILRCLHPPAAAVALIVVLGHVLHYRYAVFPVMIDSILLVVAGGVYSNLTGKAYPNHPK